MDAEDPAVVGPVRRISSGIAVAAGTPIERVWAVLTDLRLMPRLHPQVLEAHPLDGHEELVPGARFVTLNAGEAGVWRATSRVVALCPDATIAWTVESDAAPAAVCRFDLLDGPDGVTVQQTWFVDTRSGAAPPVEEALASTSGCGR